MNRRPFGAEGGREPPATQPMSPVRKIEDQAGIGSASAARPGAAWKGSAKYWVSCVTKPSVISMTLTEYVGTPS
jgi:hypothetical protein